MSKFECACCGNDGFLGEIFCPLCEGYAEDWPYACGANRTSQQQGRLFLRRALRLNRIEDLDSISKSNISSFLSASPCTSKVKPKINKFPLDLILAGLARRRNRERISEVSYSSSSSDGPRES